MDLQKSMTRASQAGKANWAVKLAKAGQPDGVIAAALGVTAGFIAKAKHSAGLDFPMVGVAKSGFAYNVRSNATTKADEPTETSAPLRKCVRLSLGKGRPSTGTGAVIANLIKKQHAEGSSYEQIHRLLNPDREADGISLYAVKSVIEFGETLV